MPYQSAKHTGITLLTAELPLNGGTRTDLVVALSLHSSLTKPHQPGAKEPGSSTKGQHYSSD